MAPRSKAHQKRQLASQLKEAARQRIVMEQRLLAEGSGAKRSVFFQRQGHVQEAEAAVAARASCDGYVQSRAIQISAEARQSL